MALHLTKT